ncbi:hypothetical protein Taro_005468 [Colocasia esculenta]|uniref:Trichome birefringence-like N-terminal domain-containing protein n=1 Tax=Colocasia esculenta TaxID=4460 RepID=A0A843TUN3_COLES|nr:hypothetical protein [Colocasia esculenta]
MAAARDAVRRKPAVASLLLSLICLASLLLSFSSFRSPSSSDAAADSRRSDCAGRGTRDGAREGRRCNYSEGIWVPDPSLSLKTRYGNTCREIFKGWNCISSSKSNALELIGWRWRPSGCEFPPLDPVRFLRRYRNTNIGFVGDSLNRNMFVSLVCTLRQAASGEVKKWRPAGADRGFTFLDYNLTVAYHRTNLLVRYSRWSASTEGGELESLGYKQGYRVDVDVPEHTWADAPNFHDILIFNTGHWWYAPSKFDPVESPMLFFEKGMPLVPVVSPEYGLDMALKNMISYVERIGRNSIKIFRTQSPRHFEGGDWNEGGSCRRTKPLLPEQVEQLFSLRNNGTNMEARLVNQHLFKALRGSNFYILDVTHMSEFRADGHPSVAVPPSPIHKCSSPKLFAGGMKMVLFLLCKGTHALPFSLKTCMDINLHKACNQVTADILNRLCAFAWQLRGWEDRALLFWSVRFKKLHSQF